MQLTFHASHLSIKEFPTIELPNFTLITGLNGTGKSHLLQAILENKIHTGVTTDRNEIRFFDWTNMVPNDTGYYDGHAEIQQRNNLFENVFAQRARFDDQIIAVARNSGVSGRILNDATELSSLSLDDLKKLLSDDEKANQAYQKIQTTVQNVSRQVENSIGDQNLKEQLETIKKETGKPTCALRRKDFFETKSIPSWGRTNIFQHSFAQLFVAYRDLALNNALRQFKRSKGREDVWALTDDEFVKQHMGPPWNFVNDTLKTAGLDFKINSPDEHDFTPFQPKLTKISSGAEINFSNLSSGEKVLMSFALCLYFANDSRQLTNYPKLLLLDEIDAPLHPSMSKNLMRAITETLVGKHNIKVIATTHSPSTVALSPEEALFAMQPSAPGLHKISKAQALNILTEGVPTLAISFEGRRQVFVESAADAENYALAFEVARPFLQSERSLEFVATGFSKKEGDVNTGCDIVKRLVGDLTKLGNRSVFGLIDWDGKNVSDGRVLVLADNMRNGLENIILDPLIVAALVANDARASFKQIGLTGLSYIDLLNAAPPTLQQVIERVETAVLGRVARLDTTKGYLGGVELKLDREYLQMDDHLLQTKVLQAFPPLNGVSKNRPGYLMRHAIQTVLHDKPEFLPLDLVKSFREILEAENH